jgi:hypothetical protein
VDDQHSAYQKGLAAMGEYGPELIARSLHNVVLMPSQGVMVTLWRCRGASAARLTHLPHPVEPCSSCARFSKIA